MPHAAFLPAASQITFPIRSLTALRKAEAACTRCPLYRDATQVVPGEGLTRASIMLVGEQPGDKEDLAGRPFVGPAGQMLDRALVEAGIARETTFVTNAVKHFKHEQRGKRRLHKRPNTHEIERCNVWLEHEMAIVRPAVIVALGAVAARGLFGRTITIAAERGSPLRLANGTSAFVTIHPSYLLRIREHDARSQEYEKFVADLADVRAFVGAGAKRSATAR